jgi:hypothetical protein
MLKIGFVLPKYRPAFENIRVPRPLYLKCLVAKLAFLQWLAIPV